MIKHIRKHYHWIIAATLFLMAGMRGGIGNNLSGLHLIPVTEALQITRAQFALAGSASSVVAMFSTMFSGTLISRYGCRSLMSFFLLIGATSAFLMGTADTYPLFFLGYALWGMTNGFCGDAIATRIVSSWFHKHKGAVFGTVSSASGVGGSIVCIFQSALIQRYSYHTSYYLAAVLLVLCCALVMVFIRKHPTDMKLQPYGYGEQVAHKKREHDDHWAGLHMKQLVRTPAFYMMIVGTFLSCVLPWLAFYVVVPHLQDRGLSPTQASSMQSLLLLCLTGSKILAGFLCDAIGARKVALICMVFNIAGLILLATVGGMTSAIIAIIIYSLALPILTVVIPLLATSLFGYQAQTQYTGIFLSMASAASIVASPISNAIYDRIGTYNPVFFVAAGVTILLMGGYLLMYRLADKQKAAIS